METITINNKEYKTEDFNEQQVYYLNQIQDINSKESFVIINISRF